MRRLRRGWGEGGLRRAPPSLYMYTYVFAFVGSVGPLGAVTRGPKSGTQAVPWLPARQLTTYKEAQIHGEVVEGWVEVRFSAVLANILAPL